jgi:hypothetical protein
MPHNFGPYVASLDVAAAPERVFGVILVQIQGFSPSNFSGETLEQRLISGITGQRGAVSEVRISAGVYDLTYEETILVSDAPWRLVVSQRPVDLYPYDPNERLPPLGADRPTDDGRKMFAHLFGATPPLLSADFSITSKGAGTHLTVAVTTTTENRPGWLTRRRIPRDMIRDARRFCEMVAKRV